MDLEEVKKVVISLANVYPEGISLDRLNQQYQKQEGCSIPFTSFGYLSLLCFLESELGQKITIINEGFGCCMVYPKASEKSGHILELTKNPRNRGIQSANNQQRPKMNNKPTNCRQSPSSLTQAGNRSPTMPKLLPYRPFKKHPSQATTVEQEMVSQRLKDSFQAFLTRNNNSKNQRNNNNNRSNQRPNPKQSNSINYLMQEMKQQKFNGQGMNHQQDITKSTAASTYLHPLQTPASGSGIQKTVTPSITSQEPTFENIWDDEWENIEPPPKNSQSNASSFYGVSDIDESTSTKSSHKSCQRMLLSSSDDEQTQTDLRPLLDELHVGDTVPVRISDLNNPLKFWLHLRQQKYVMQLNKIHNEMQQFYTANKNSPELKVKDIEGGDYFAACFDYEWYRVDIYDTNRLGEAVQVSFIDYGTRETINISNMRRLVEEFRTTPKMAVCCALGNIKPIGNAFTGSSADKFLELVDDEKMFANILHIDTNKSKAVVELILQSNKKCVNEELIKLGHGVKKTVKRTTIGVV